jgi:hypothetical protein
MESVLTCFEILRRWLLRFGPLAVVAIALPGGSLLALALYLHQRRKSSNGGSLAPGVGAEGLTGPMSL